MTAPVIVRPMQDFERNIVRAMWKRSLIRSHFGKRPKREYWAIMNYFVDHLLFRASVLIAAPEEDPDLICAWLAVLPSRAIHQMTRSPYEGMGIEKVLLDAAGFEQCPQFDPIEEMERFNAEVKGDTTQRCSVCGTTGHAASNDVYRGSGGRAA